MAYSTCISICIHVHVFQWNSFPTLGLATERESLCSDQPSPIGLNLCKLLWVHIISFGHKQQEIFLFFLDELLQWDLLNFFINRRQSCHKQLLLFSWLTTIPTNQRKVFCAFWWWTRIQIWYFPTDHSLQSKQTKIIALKGKMENILYLHGIGYRIWNLILIISLF